MARGSLAPESIIANELRILGCSHRNFCAVAGFPYGTFGAVMAGSRDLEPGQAERLREKIEQMKELERSVGVPVDWSRSEEVANILALRLVKRILDEEHTPSEEWSQLTEQATNRLR